MNEIKREHIYQGQCLTWGAPNQPDGTASYTIPWKYVLDIESMSNQYEGYPFVCRITLIMGKMVYIIGNFKVLNEEYIEALTNPTY